MIDEFTRKRLLLEYCRLLNAADLEGLLTLCEDTISVEDPVGVAPLTGRAALRMHLETALAAQVHVTPGDAVAGQDRRHALLPATSVMNFFPRGPVFVDRGWLSMPATARHMRLRCDHILMIRMGATGRIQRLLSLWGRSDLTVVSGEMTRQRQEVRHVPDELTRKRILLEYHSRMNAGDVDAVLSLFADDIVFEDPVGIAPIVGRQAVRRHIAWSIGLQAWERPGTPVATMDDRRVAAPVTVTVRLPAPLTFRIVGVIEIGEDQLIHKAQAFWGVTDTTVGERPASLSAADFVAVTEHLAQIKAQRFGAPGPTTDTRPA